MSDVSELLRSLTKNEQLWGISSDRSQKWANCSFFWEIRSFAHYSIIFLQKTSAENRWANSQPPKMKVPLKPPFFFLFPAKQVLLLLHGWIDLEHNKKTAKNPIFSTCFRRSRSFSSAWRGRLLTHYKRTAKPPFFLPVFGEAGPSPSAGGVVLIRIISEQLKPPFFYLFAAKQKLLFCMAG